jgi:hypothetical protein
MALDPKFRGDWTVKDVRKTAAFAIGDILTVSDSDIVTKRTSAPGPHTPYMDKFTGVVLKSDGTTEVTTARGTIVFNDEHSALYTTTTGQLDLEKGAAPGPSPGTGSEKSGDTGMALILGLVLVGLFAFNDVF